MIWLRNETGVESRLSMTLHRSWGEADMSFAVREDMTGWVPLRVWQKRELSPCWCDGLWEWWSDRIARWNSCGLFCACDVDKTLRRLFACKEKTSGKNKR